MENKDLLPLFMFASDWAEKLAESLVFGVRPGQERDNLRILSTLGLKLAIAIAKEVVKLPEDDKPIEKGDKR